MEPCALVFHPLHLRTADKRWERISIPSLDIFLQIMQQCAIANIRINQIMNPKAAIAPNLLRSAEKWSDIPSNPLSSVFFIHLKWQNDTPGSAIVDLRINSSPVGINPALTAAASAPTESQKTQRRADSLKYKHHLNVMHQYIPSEIISARCSWREMARLILRSTLPIDELAAVISQGG